MAGVMSDEAAEGFSSGQRCQSGEALAEWRSSEQVENGTPSTSPPYWDTDDDDGGPKPSKLFGKYTWKIEKFSQISKRELRSNAFEIGGHKWYILIYPQGCDVCNHLSLFLCVANHDKLLPGWSHFAQFTIAAVNKDPKKSKYSDTLHRFWKKEHDWGWKKFMELSKVSDGFLDSSDTLIIKAQVQVIRERADRPFRCLDRQYRRELVRVYLTNVEQICRRFVEERRSKLWKLLEDKNRWKSINDFWKGMDRNSQWRMSREKAEVILKVLVKHFFIEKEVTSTLVMDSLYSGLKALEGQNMRIKEKKKSLDTEQIPDPIVCIKDDEFILVDDVLKLLERATLELLPPRDEKGPQNRTKDDNSGEDFNMDSIERDERRLTELGRRTLEIYVLAHIFSYKIEVAYQEDIALKRQEELIREEEAQWLAESDQKVRRGTTDKEKKSKRKQAKQKRNNHKGKGKGRDERAVQDKHQGDVLISDNKDTITEPVSENPDILEDASDVSDSVDVGTEIHQPDSEDRDASQVNSDTDTSEAPTLAETSIINGISPLLSVQNVISEKRGTFAMDDSSSTCSTDSVPLVVTNGSSRVSSNSNNQYVQSPSRGKNSRGEASDVNFTSEMNGHFTGSRADVENVDNVLVNSKAVECVSEAAVSASQDRSSHSEHLVVKKVVEEVLPKKLSTEVSVPPSSRSPPSCPPKNPGSAVQSKAEKISASIDHALSRKVPSNGSQRPNKPGPTVLSPQHKCTPKPENQNVSTLKSSELPALQQPPTMPRPTPARVGQISPSLNRSVSATARVGPEPSPTAQSYTPFSYRNAIVGNPIGSISAAFTSPSIGVNPPPSLASGSMNPVQSGLSSGMTNRGTLRNGPHQIESTQGVADEFPHIDIINDLLDEENSNGIATESGGVFQSHSNGQHFQRSYSSIGSLLETARDYVPLASPLAYANGHMDGLILNQWHTNATDVSYLGNAETDGLAYFSSNYSNLACNGNGYSVFTPPSGI